MFATRAVRAYAHAAPVDMRKGFEGLSALVRLGMNHDLLSGNLYLFVNRHRTRAKVLLWDGTGLCVYAKRLEKGRFAALWREEGQVGLALSLTELQLFLEGSALVGKITLTPPPFSHKELAIVHTSL
jgi:transposase